MNRLNQLADWVEQRCCTAEDINYLAALLRAAAAETVGTEWLPTDDGSVFIFDCGDGSAQAVRLRSNTEAAIVKRRHEADLAAARLAVADARKERDEAVRVLDAANDSNDRLRAAINRLEQAELSALAELDEANAKNAALQRELDSALEQKQGHACAMATLAEERDEALATAERHRNDTWQHAEAVRTLEAERATLQQAIDKAYGRWLLSSEMSTTSDSMARVLCPNATRREDVKAPTVAENATVDPDKSPDIVSGSPVPGADPAVTLAFKQSLNKASEIVKDWPAWKRDILKPAVFGPGCSPHPLPTGPTPAAAPLPTELTPAVSPCCRELIARMAECIIKDREHDYHGSEFENALDAIIRDARKGGAE